jgi:hypothetical protein
MWQVVSGIGVLQVIAICKRRHRTVELENLTRKIDGKTDEMSLRATSVYRQRMAPGG